PRRQICTCARRIDRAAAQRVHRRSVAPRSLHLHAVPLIPAAMRWVAGDGRADEALIRVTATTICGTDVPIDPQRYEGATMLRVSDSITLDDREVHERFVRAFGPGGQNVRKEETAVELRFDVGLSRLPPDVKERLVALSGRA